jgi:capsular polysaccharide transport system permease protein
MDGTHDQTGSTRPIHGSGRQADPGHGGSMENLKRRALEYRWSLLLVGLPTLLCALYYFLIAADLYASEARFVVRTPSRQQAMGLNALLQGSGISRTQDDVFSVHDFILSRDAIAAVGKQADLRALFGRPEADFLAGYPNLVYRGNAEDFFRYWQTRVAVTYDTTTGISTLEVKAFRPEDAHQLASLLLAESEALVNRMNERAHNNAVRDAEQQVALAEERVSVAQQNVLDYRRRETLLDPGKASGAIFETVAKMQAELAATRSRLAELERNSPGSPLRSNLQTHAAALSGQIESLKGSLAGSDGSMAPKISEYEQLMLRQEFATRELTSTMASLESARAEARRQQIYLDRVVEPNQPDKALFPRRIRSVLTIFVGLFMIYVTGKLLVAGVREHSQD